MKKILIGLLFLTLIALGAVPSASAETPSLRLLKMEGMQNVTWYNPMGIPISCLEINFTFALTPVATQGDRCYYTLWSGLRDTVVMGNWSIGFSANPGLPPGCQGVYGVTGFIADEIYSAEFPYGSITIDGVLHYLYRIHIYVDSAVFKGATLYFGGNYLTSPTLQGSSLSRLKVTAVTGNGVAVFKAKVLHDN